MGLKLKRDGSQRYLVRLHSSDLFVVRKEGSEWVIYTLELMIPGALRSGNRMVYAATSATLTEAKELMLTRLLGEEENNSN